MAQGRRVSFVAQEMKWREPGDEGDGLLMLAPRPQQKTSVFTRLGPRRDLPYVPQPVGEPPLAGMIFGCTAATYDECIRRQLFGLPAQKHKPQVLRIAPGAAIFLFDFMTKRMHGIFEATSHGGVHIVREAFGGKFEAQVKVRLMESCPFLDEKDFKDAIRENYRDAKRFNFPLSEAQVCRLKLLFRQKPAGDSALSVDLNYGHRVVQFCPHQANNFNQAQSRVISSVSKDEMDVSVTSAPPALPRIHNSSFQTRSHSLGGLEVSVCSTKKEDKKYNDVSESPRRHVVTYDKRKEQSTTPILESKNPRPARQEVVKEILSSRLSRETPQDRKRRVDASPHGVQEYTKEQGQEIDDGGSDKICIGDLRELLKGKRLKPTTRQQIKSVVNQPMDPPVYSGGNIAIGDVLFIDDSKRNMERVLPLPRKKLSTISSGSPKVESSQVLVTSRSSKKAEAIEGARTIRPVQDVKRKLTIASVPADVVQLRTTASDHCVNSKNVEDSLIKTRSNEIGYNNAEKELNAAKGNGVGGSVDLSANFPLYSGVLQNLDDAIRESCPSDEPKDSGVGIYVSLTVDKAAHARQSTSSMLLKNYHEIGHVVRCVLGKRARGSEQDDAVLDSAMEPDSLLAETSMTKRMEVLKGSHSEDPISKDSLKSAETLPEREQGNYSATAPVAEDQNLTSQRRARKTDHCVENLSEEGMRADHVQSGCTNLRPLNDVAPVIGIVITNNAGDLTALDCKRLRAGKENDPSSSVHKLDKIGHNEAGCSYVTPEVSSPTEESDLREKFLRKNEMPSQNSYSLISGKSGNLWNSRTLRYGKPRSSDAIANQESRVSSKSWSEPTNAVGKSYPYVRSIKLGEEITHSGGENYGRKPESQNAKEASRTRGKLDKHDALLICELGNPGGLPLDSNMVSVDTKSEILSKHQPSTVASVVQQFMLPTEVTSSSRPDKFQTKNTSPTSSSSEFESFESRKDLVRRESEAADMNFRPDDFPSVDSVQPTIVACNEERACPILLIRKEPMPLKTKPIPLKLELMPLEIQLISHRADAAEVARDQAVEDWLYARDRGSSLACTNTALLSDCSRPGGEPELEINIPIKEEELEICLPIEEEKEVHARP